jgi:PAS domain S-box-containing protein
MLNLSWARARKSQEIHSVADNRGDRSRTAFQSEVEGRFGILPNFFCTAKSAPGLIEELWGLAKSAYLDSPFPSIFKERLFVHLSRFCEVRYCIIRHVGFLLGQGRPAGDLNSPIATVEQVIALLRRPVPDTTSLAAAYERLRSSNLLTMPEPDTQAESDLFDALTIMFIDPTHSTIARESVKAAVGDSAFELLVAFLAFIRTAHYWTETHPELDCEPDMVELMSKHSELSSLLRNTFEAEAAKERQDVLRMSARLEQTEQAAEEALRESEERLRTVGDNISQLAWTCDRLGNVTWYNKRWLDYTGLSFEEMKDWGWKRVHHPDHVDRVVAGVTRSRESGGPWEDTFPLRGVDGNYRWFLSRAVPIRNAAGEIMRWFGTNTDITEQRKADETQRMLTSELSHRVKNMLATVQAIATQTLRHSQNPAQFVTSFGGRIQSMSRMHSMLSSSDWQGADLRDVIRDQLFLGPIDETRVTAGGPAVRLEPQIAPQVAMMLHELGTNSIKYGALSKPDGVVTIGWSVNDDMLRLRWVERGGPPLKAPVKRGFGTTLIEQTAKGTGGSAHMSIEMVGVQWEICLPLPRADAIPLSKREVVHAAPWLDEGGGADAPPLILAGKRFLVVEDEPLVALDIMASLEHAGVNVAGSAGSASEALSLIERTALDAALIDANLHGQLVGDIAAALTRKNVPFIFVTGYGRESLPAAFAGPAVLSKPFSQRQLLEAAARLVQKPADVHKLRP